MPHCMIVSLNTLLSGIEAYVVVIDAQIVHVANPMQFE